MLSEWLDEHGADTSAAASLAETTIAIDVLNELAASLDKAALHSAIQWVSTGSATRVLASDLEHTATRISSLVGAMKRFTYMDRALAPEAVDIAGSLNDSVALLEHKAREQSVAVEVHTPPGLPPARAIGGDMNQVWMNLLDNALDASPESGLVTISAERVLDRIVVRMVDNGPGIPSEIRHRIFDPFVTSKPVGQGRGLGLDITRQLVRRNDGDIEVDSTPGRTEFRVLLRVDESATADTRAAQ